MRFEMQEKLMQFACALVGFGIRLPDLKLILSSTIIIPKGRRQQ